VSAEQYDRVLLQQRQNPLTVRSVELHAKTLKKKTRHVTLQAKKSEDEASGVES
jgi:hypothetical protein